MSRFWNGVARAFDLSVAPAFGAPGFHARRKTWDDPDIEVDLTSRTFVVTGANSGLGKATTRALAARGGHVLMACRSASRAEAARDEILASVPNARLTVERVDLSDLDDVRDFAARCAAYEPDVLVHNAGLLVDERERSPQGYELTFAVHVLGPFLLTRALESQLASATDGRLIFVSSGGMYTQRLRVEHLLDGLPRFDGAAVYAQAKRAQVLLAHRFAERMRQDGVAVSSMHPGWADTPGVRSALPAFHRITRSFLRDADQGADTIVWLAASSQARDAGGEFYFDRQVRTEHAPLARTRSTDAEVDALWELCECCVAPFAATAPGDDRMD